MPPSGGEVERNEGRKWFDLGESSMIFFWPGQGQTFPPQRSEAGQLVQTWLGGLMFGVSLFHDVSWYLWCCRKIWYRGGCKKFTNRSACDSSRMAPVVWSTWRYPSSRWFKAPQSTHHPQERRISFVDSFGLLFVALRPSDAGKGIVMVRKSMKIPSEGQR